MSTSQSNLSATDQNLLGKALTTLDNNSKSGELEAQAQKESPTEVGTEVIPPPHPESSLPLEASPPGGTSSLETKAQSKVNEESNATSTAAPEKNPEESQHGVTSLRVIQAQDIVGQDGQTAFIRVPTSDDAPTDSRYGETGAATRQDEGMTSKASNQASLTASDNSSAKPQLVSPSDTRHKNPFEQHHRSGMVQKSPDVEGNQTTANVKKPLVDLESKMTAVKADLQDQVQILATRHKQTRGRHDREIQGLQNQLDEIISSHQSRFDAMKDYFSKCLKEKEEAHQAEIAALKEQFIIELAKSRDDRIVSENADQGIAVLQSYEELQAKVVRDLSEFDSVLLQDKTECNESQRNMFNHFENKISTIQREGETTQKEIEQRVEATNKQLTAIQQQLNNIGAQLVQQTRLSENQYAANRQAFSEATLIQSQWIGECRNLRLAVSQLEIQMNNLRSVLQGGAPQVQFQMHRG